MKNMRILVGAPLFVIAIPVGFIFTKLIFGFITGMEYAGFHFREIISDKFGVIFK